MRITIQRFLKFLLTLTSSAVFSLTHGQAAASVPLTITKITANTNGVTLSWTGGEAGSAFRVESRSILGSGQWAPAVGGVWPTTATTWADTAITEGTRFYRVVAAPGIKRGTLVSSSLQEEFSQAEIALLFFLQGVPLTPLHGVRVYKLTYETIDAHGAPARATGALALPAGASASLPLVSYQHGTLTRKADAPSTMSLGEVFIGVAMATDDYAVALPDYLGLGDSPGLHPYHHAKSEATASVDMLRAVRAHCASNQVALDGKLFLCGYSQGGHATMALHRELETLHADEFPVTASAPMAGAYDLSGVTTADFLSGRIPPNPYYFAYILAAYQDVYHIAESFADLLAPPYSTTLPPLFDGRASGSEINAKMPADPTQILKPELLAAFRNDPDHPLRAALRDNDLYAWTPRAPLRLYHCQGDEDVIQANSRVALQSFLDRGATQVSLVDPLPVGGHGDCVLPSLLSAKAWFDGF